MHGLDDGEVPGAVSFEPGAQAPDRRGVGAPGVRVADGDEEELDEPGGDLGPARGDHGRQGHVLHARDDDRRALDPDEAASCSFFHAPPSTMFLREQLA